MFSGKGRLLAVLVFAGLLAILSDAEASPYAANPDCNEFKPICDTPQTVPWPNQEMWTATGKQAEGAVRVLEGTHSDFQAWKAANSSFDSSPCSGPDMRDCCLKLSTANDGTDYCPVPYNDKVLTLVAGERLTLRLPPSPCDPNDNIPLSGYSKVTGESLQAHQVGLCQEADGSQYGCIHIDGRQAGPASLLVTAYYGKSQGTCSAARSFGTSEFGSSSSSVLSSAFGTGLDERFNNGQSNLPPCCLNTIMLSVDVVEPLLGDAPVALDKEKISEGKPRMVKGGIMLKNVSINVCQSMQEPLRSVIAKHTASFIKKSDVWLECLNGDFQKSTKTGGVIAGSYDETSFVNYEVYMSTQNFLGAFLSATPGLQALIDNNDGTENNSGFVTSRSNYVFIEDLNDQIDADGLDDIVRIGQAEASLTDYQAYAYSSGTTFAAKTWQPMDGNTWGSGVASLKPFTPLNGQTTALSAASQRSNCPASDNPYCIGLARHNELRAEGGLQELEWDSDLAESATGYAQDLCELNRTAHDLTSNSLEKRENIHEFIPGSGEDEVAISNRGIMLARAAESWSLEREFYNYSRLGATCGLDWAYSAADDADSYARLYGMSGSSVWGGAVTELVAEEKRMVSHFTLMMGANMNRIGCGAVRCSEVGPTASSMLSPQNRWVVVCHYAGEDMESSFPFSERTAHAFTRSMETGSPDDDTSLCYTPCDGAMTTEERNELNAFDADVPLTAAPTGYSKPDEGECLVPELPLGDYVPASELTD